MIDIQLTENERLSHAQKLLAGIPGGVEKAVKSTMTRVASNLRTNSSKAIRERYDISLQNIRANENVKIRYSYGNGIQASVIFSGAKIPLYRYGGSSPKQPTASTAVTNAIVNGFWKRVHPSLSATGHQLKSTAPTRFDNAFVAKMGSGHIGIFERTGGSTSSGGDAIRELMGSSVPQMLGSKEVEENIANKAAELFDSRMEHEVIRLLNGWGG